MLGRRSRGEGLSHEFFDHTGDIGVRLRAPTLAGLFEQAAIALTDAMTASAVNCRVSEEIALESSDLDLLLVDWLSELLFRFDARGLLVARAHVEIVRADVYRLGARVEGEPLDPARHGMKVLLKAVTYHALEVKETPEGWFAQVIFDI
jgi:SHS2 domain-containing protein